MKRVCIHLNLLWVVVIVVLLGGCAGSPEVHRPTRSSSTPSPLVSPSVPASVATLSPHVRLLQPESPIPATCPASPVSEGGPAQVQGTEDIAQIQAQPLTSGIYANLFYARGLESPPGTYRLIHTGGGWSDGAMTKILWIVTHPQANTPLHIKGTMLSDPTKIFEQSFEGVHEVPSIVNIPSAGCWSLEITSGNAKGTIVLWAVG